MLACARLRISNSRYFTEHIHIDQYHAKDALQALREVEVTMGMDWRKAWIGVRLASTITSQAFEAAVAKARRGVHA